MSLDNAREEMNAALDEAKRALRTDAVDADYRKIKVIKTGPFTVNKKWSGFYIVEMFTELAKGCGVYDAAVDEGVIQVSTTVSTKKAEEFLRKKSLDQKFKACVDGKELTPAVSGPKPIAAFGGIEEK